MWKKGTFSSSKILHVSGVFSGVLEEEELSEKQNKKTL